MAPGLRADDAPDGKSGGEAKAPSAAEESPAPDAAKEPGPGTGPAAGPEAKAPADKPADTKPKADAEKSALWSHVQLDYRYVYRVRNGKGRNDHDQDMYQDLFVEGGLGDSFRFEVSGRVKEDIDGRPRVSWFRDLYDTYSSWAHGHLYTAYGEALDLGALARVRLGRQYYGEGVNVRFDGGLVETAALGDLVKLIGYAGVPAHLYESSPREDWLAGGAVEVTYSFVRVRFDGVHVTDRRDDLHREALRDGVRRDERRDDTLFLGTVTVVPTEWLRVLGRASTFDGRSTRAEGEVFLENRDLGASLRARYIAQLGAYRDLSIEFSPLDERLGQYRPYQEGLVEARILLLEDHLGLGTGVAVRQLFRKRDEGTFNHEFLRVYGSVDVSDWPWNGLLVSTMAEWYRALELGHTFQLSGEVSQKFGDFKLGGGSRFSAWRADEFFLVERKYVRGFFGTGEWRPFDWFRLRLTYDYEVSHEDRFHVLRCDARIQF